MKKRIAIPATALLLASLLAVGCNSSGSTNGPGTENPVTSQEPAASYNANAGTAGDSASLKNADAGRLSDGKDSVKGEITPPNASEQ